MLKSLGHLIEEATNDRVAVRLMDRNNIDLVLAGAEAGRTGTSRSEVVWCEGMAPAGTGW